ncbi:hypothetical protein INT45_007591 [Circinella minor]|uniref:Phospholipid scramblase n=1 Tax=Circinella minor TaxID=1195481 RepID=A0A8H7RXG4_9FUNG|nr:hypothetical protein INT45_007591 [Circinella minor]
MLPSRRLIPALRSKTIHVRPTTFTRTQPITAHYSSLRRPPRQGGPRGRILNHVENYRPVTATQQQQQQQTQQPYPEQQQQQQDQQQQQQPNNVLIQQDEHFSSDPAHTPVHIPQKPGAIITPDYHGAAMLSQSALVVGREFEMMNIFLGYEQANKYKIMDPNGNYVGYIAEEEGFMKSLSRQFLRTHRPMNATILDVNGNVVYKIVRPFAFINSRIYIYTSDDQLVGEVQQRWHMLRRKYDLFVGNQQFANIDTPFLGWDFYLQNESGGALANINRNFTGFARELFTDTGQYVLRMDAVEDTPRGMTLDERAVTLACAVSIDFDYFSRHSSHGGGGFMPLPFFGFGGSGEGGDQPQQDNPTSDQPMSQTPQPPPPTTGYGGQDTPQTPPSNTNGWGDDGWMSDEEAGVSSPEDEDVVSQIWGFFNDDD